LRKRIGVLYEKPEKCPSCGSELEFSGWNMLDYPILYCKKEDREYIITNVNK